MTDRYALNLKHYLSAQSKTKTVTRNHSTAGVIATPQTESNQHRPHEATHRKELALPKRKPAPLTASHSNLIPAGNRGWFGRATPDLTNEEAMTRKRLDGLTNKEYRRMMSQINESSYCTKRPLSEFKSKAPTRSRKCSSCAKEFMPRSNTLFRCDACKRYQNSAINDIGGIYYGQAIRYSG